MSNILKKINIHIQNLNKRNDEGSSFFAIKNYKKLLNSGMTIVDINTFNVNYLTDIYKCLKGRCQIIQYIEDYNMALDVKKNIKKPNYLVYNSSFESNFLKNNIADIIIGKNILLDKNNKKILNEVNRILNFTGNVFFIEFISINDIFSLETINNKNYLTHAINVIKQKLKNLKNCEYEIEIFGKGNFQFESNNEEGFLELIDILNKESIDNKNITSNLFELIVEANLST